MNVAVLRTPAATLKALKELCSWADEIHMAFAWISSGAGKAPHWILPLQRVKTAVIGIHFAQTEPDALEQLAHIAPHVLKVIEDTEGVFHPKILLGSRTDDVRALVGSSNFTRGGFCGNTELNVLLSGTRKEKEIVELELFLKDQWNSTRAKEPDSDWFARYREAHKRRPRPPRLVLPEAIPSQRPNISTFKDLDVAW